MKIIDGKVHRFVELIVYGCQMNVSDAERMEGQLETIGYEPTEEMTEADIDYMIQAVKEVVAYLRGFSPVWRDLTAGRTPFIL